MGNMQNDDYERMAVWRAFVRRHDANVFDVFFYDREQLTQQDVEVVAKQVADFFELPLPVVNDSCELIAEVMIGDDAEKYELSYSWQLMKRFGINNRDALTMVVVHEMTHRLVYATRFMIFDNEFWIHELLADMMAGAYSVVKGGLATGKYKHTLASWPATLSHPDGKIRTKAVDFGRVTVEQLVRECRYDGLKSVVSRLPMFVYAHYNELMDDWERVVAEGQPQLGLPLGKGLDVDSFPNITYEARLLREYQDKLAKDNERNKI